MSTVRVRSSSTVKPAAASIGPQSAPRCGTCSAWKLSVAAWARSSRPGRSSGASAGRKRGKPASSTTANRPPGASSSRTLRRARSGRAMWCIEADAHTRPGVPRSGQWSLSRSARTVRTRSSTPRARAFSLRIRRCPAELSTAVTCASGKRSRSAKVPVPVPQPRSTIRRGSLVSGSQAVTDARCSASTSASRSRISA